jgi:hypothetical protein
MPKETPSKQRNLTNSEWDYGLGIHWPGFLERPRTPGENRRNFAAHSEFLRDAAPPYRASSRGVRIAGTAPQGDNE